MNSDTDILLPPKSKFLLILLIFGRDDSYGEYTESDFISYFLEFENKKYNFIYCTSMESYNAWLFATIKMKQSLQDDSKFLEKIRSKKYRVKVFEKLKEQYKEF